MADLQASGNSLIDIQIIALKKKAEKEKNEKIISLTSKYKQQIELIEKDMIHD
jgi:hypothetical protein